MIACRIYLRASTKDQDAQRAEQLLDDFAHERGMVVAGKHIENASGTRLDRPELQRLLSEAKEGEVLLVESVDRLSRLSQDEWKQLKDIIYAKGLRLVVADLPTSHQLSKPAGSITAQIMEVINGMLIDLMATMARLDQEKRVERIKQGLAKRRAKGEKVGGRTADATKHALIQKHLRNPELTIEEVAKLAGCGVATVYRAKKSQTHYE